MKPAQSQKGSHQKDIDGVVLLIFFANFEKVLHIPLLFPMLTLSRLGYDIRNT